MLLQIQNKRIKVALARPRNESGKRANLYVKNIPPTLREEDVHNLFAEYGLIVQCRLLKTPDGKSKGVAFVLFEVSAVRTESARNQFGYVIFSPCSFTSRLMRRCTP